MPGGIIESCRGSLKIAEGRRLWRKWCGVHLWESWPLMGFGRKCRLLIFFDGTHSNYLTVGAFFLFFLKRGLVWPIVHKKQLNLYDIIQKCSFGEKKKRRGNRKKEKNILGGQVYKYFLANTLATRIRVSGSTYIKCPKTILWVFIRFTFVHFLFFLLYRCWVIHTL